MQLSLPFPVQGDVPKCSLLAVACNGMPARRSRGYVPVCGNMDICGGSPLMSLCTRIHAVPTVQNKISETRAAVVYKQMPRRHFP